MPESTEAANLMAFAGAWQGDDMAVCLALAVETRSPAQFPEPESEDRPC